jgi:hypothetical protein
MYVMQLHQCLHHFGSGDKVKGQGQNTWVMSWRSFAALELYLLRVSLNNAHLFVHVFIITGCDSQCSFAVQGHWATVACCKWLVGAGGATCIVVPCPMYCIPGPWGGLECLHHLY